MENSKEEWEIELRNLRVERNGGEFIEKVIIFIESLLSKEKDACKKLLNSGRGMYEQGMKDEKARIREEIGKMKKQLPKTKCINAENHVFGSCFQCEKIKGFNQALEDIKEILK